MVEYAPATGETRVRFPDGVEPLQLKRPIFHLFVLFFIFFTPFVQIMADRFAKATLLLTLALFPFLSCVMSVLPPGDFFFLLPTHTFLVLIHALLFLSCSSFFFQGMRKNFIAQKSTV